MQFRRASHGDLNMIRDIYMSAFPLEESSIVSKLAIELFEMQTTPPTFSLVAEHNGFLVGHVAFSPVSMEGMDSFQGYILAPLAVHPDHQKRGVGSNLVDQGIQRLSSAGADMLFVYGDPDFYGRFGFGAEIADRFEPPYPLKYAFGWLGMTMGQSDLPSSHVKITCVSALCDPAIW